MTPAAEPRASGSFDLADYEAIHEPLLVGLASYGEIERLANAQGIAELAGQSIPPGLRVIHPTGSADTVSAFAEALRTLNVLRHGLRQRAAPDPEG